MLVAGSGSAAAQPSRRGTSPPRSRARHRHRRRARSAPLSAHAGRRRQRDRRHDQRHPDRQRQPVPAASAVGRDRSRLAAKGRLAALCPGRPLCRQRRAARRAGQLHRGRGLSRGARRIARRPAGGRPGDHEPRRVGQISAELVRDGQAAVAVLLRQSAQRPVSLHRHQLRRVAQGAWRSPSSPSANIVPTPVDRRAVVSRRLCRAVVGPPPEPRATRSAPTFSTAPDLRVRAPLVAGASSLRR